MKNALMLRRRLKNAAPARTRCFHAMCQTVVLCCAAAASSLLLAEEAPPLAFPSPDRNFRQPLRTWQQVKSRGVVMQQQEYTCGAASLATLLQYLHGDAIDEQQVLKAALGKLSQEDLAEREKNGLSMADLSTGATELGYLAAALEVDYEKLRELPAPVIVRQVQDDFKHFVVYRGELDGRVFLADPLRGNIRLPRRTFVERWDGKMLAVLERGVSPPKQHALQVRQDRPVTPERQAARSSLFDRLPRVSP